MLCEWYRTPPRSLIRGASGWLNRSIKAHKGPFPAFAFRILRGSETADLYGLTRHGKKFQSLILDEILPVNRAFRKDYDRVRFDGGKFCGLRDNSVKAGEDR